MICGTNYSSKLDTLSPEQQQEFLSSLLAGPALPHTTLHRMAELYSLQSNPNMEIRYRWVMLGIKARWQPSVSSRVEIVRSS